MKKVLLLLPKGFEVYEMSAFHDVITWNLVDGNHETEIITCGMKKEVTGTGNIRINADVTVKNAVAGDYAALAVPGGFEEYGFYEDAYHEDILELIRAFHTEKKIIASICVGALPLGKSGILEGRRATTFNKKNGIRQEWLKAFGACVVNEPVVIDGNIITSWNPSAAMAVAFKLLEMLTTKENSEMIKELMGYSNIE